MKTRSTQGWGAEQALALAEVCKGKGPSCQDCVPGEALEPSAWVLLLLDVFAGVALDACEVLRPWLC